MTKESSNARRSSCTPRLGDGSGFSGAVSTSKTCNIDGDSAAATHSENQADSLALDALSAHDAYVSHSERSHRAIASDRRASAAARFHEHTSSSASLPLERDSVTTAATSTTYEPPPTPLEALLDLELFDAPSALEDNQFVLQEQRCDIDSVDDGDDDFGELSLELLALQSPHGKHQQWGDDTTSQVSATGCAAPGLALPHVAAMALRLSQQTERVLDLTSPSHHGAPPFQPSPRHATAGDDYDLASPVALPETPTAASDASAAARWDSDLRYAFDSLELRDATPATTATDSVDNDCVAPLPAPPPPPRTPATARSVAKRELRQPFARTTARDSASSSTSSMRTPRTPARPHPHAHTALQQASAPSLQHPLPSAPASVPKRKVKHGGIYALLLKNRAPGDHEPILVDDEKRSPEVPEDSPGRLARSTGKPQRSPVLSTAAFNSNNNSNNSGNVGSAHHGSIYRMLRQSRSGTQC